MMKSQNSTRVRAPDKTFKPTGLHTAAHHDTASPNPIGRDGEVPKAGSASYRDKIGRDPADKPEEKVALLTAKTNIGIGTWNVRTLNKDGNLEILLHQLAKYDWEIMGICETHWIQSGDFSVDGYKILCSSEDNEHRKGVALILNKIAQKALLGYKTISPRMISARFQTQAGALTVVQVYAPNMADPEDQVDSFYDQLQKVIDETPNQDLLIVSGDMNAKVGRDWDLWKHVIGQHGYGDMNSRGEKLLNFCTANNLTIANTLFPQKKDSRQWTWESPYGRTRNKIDYVMLNSNWKTSITNARSFPGADLASNHQLVICNIHLKFKTMPTIKPVKRYDTCTSKLKIDSIWKKYYNTIGGRFRLRFEHIDTSLDANETCTKIKETFNNTAEEILGMKKVRPQEP